VNTRTVALLRSTPVTILATLIVLLALCTTRAQAGTQLQWAGQSWHLFSGTGRLGQVWSPSMVHVDSTGTLNIGVNGNTSGGVGSTTYKTYGHYAATFKMTPGAGKFVAILKGHEGCPFNELDIAEGKKGDSGRTQITATRHWGTGKTNMLQHRIALNYTTWHTVSVNWTASAMVVSMDGTPFATYTSHVSHTPMDWAIQTAGANVAGSGAPSTLSVRNLVTP
jgi:hypothetical protein